MRDRRGRWVRRFVPWAAVGGLSSGKSASVATTPRRLPERPLPGGAATAPPPAPEPPRAPDILVDGATVAVGQRPRGQRRAGLADKVGRLLRGAGR